MAPSGAWLPLPPPLTLPKYARDVTAKLVRLRERGSRARAPNPRPSSRRVSAYGAAGGKGARNHLSRAHGIFLSAVFLLSRGEPLYILVGQQGEDACPGVSGAPA